MIFWATFSMMGYDSCARARPMGSSTDTKASRYKRRIIPVSFLTRFPPQRFLLAQAYGRAHHTFSVLQGAGTPARTRQMNASNSANAWKCVICLETTCLTRPSQITGTQGGWARNCTTKARSVGSGSGSWDIGDLRQRPVQAGHFRVVRGMIRKIQYALRARPWPQRANWRSWDHGSV